VTLNGPAPAGGAVVALSSNNSAAAVPANVTVLAGATTATFQVTTVARTAQATPTITATYNGTASAQLTVNPGPPTLTGISLSRAYQNQVYTVTLTGTNFTPDATINAGQGVTATVTNVSADGTTMTATFAIGAPGVAPTGIHSVSVTTPVGTTHNLVAFTVEPPPTLSGISPSSGMQGAINFPLTITGTNFDPGSTVIFSGTGITVTSTALSADQTTLNITVTIASDAPLGTQAVFVKTNGDLLGTDGHVQFTVTPAKPTLTSIVPPSGTQGQTVAVTLNGTNFGSNPQINIGPGVTATVNSSTATTINASFVIASNASTGNYNVSVTSGGMTSNSLPFTVNPATSCGTTIKLFSAPFAPNGTNTNVVAEVGSNCTASNIDGVMITEAVGLPPSPTPGPPPMINALGKPGACDQMTLTCLLGTITPGTTKVIVLNYNASALGNVTTNVTVSASNATSVSASANTFIPACTPGFNPRVLCQGQYSMSVKGPVRTATASFTTDGNGHIPGGTLDLNSLNGPMVGLSILPTSTYSFESDGTGDLMLDTSAGSFVFRFVLDPITGTSGHMIEYEPNGTSAAAGFIQLQAGAFHAAQITGPYALSGIGSMGGTSSGVRTGMLGTITADGICGFGASGATGTVNNGGTASHSVNFTGRLNPSSSCTVDPVTGRGSATFSSITGTPTPSFSTVNLTFYIMDTNTDGTANHMAFLTTDQTSPTQPLLSGMIASQHNAPYNTSAALDCGLGTNVGCVIASSGATGGNSVTGNSVVSAGSAFITTQSATAGKLSWLRDENNGGTVASGTITAAYSYLADGTGMITPQTGEVVDVVFTGIDTGFTLSEGSSVSTGFFLPQAAGPGPFTDLTQAFAAGTRMLGTVSATTTIANATVTPTSPTPSNTGTFSGTTRFWNSATHQNVGPFTGTYTRDPADRTTGTTTVPGALSFAAYRIDIRRFVLVGTTSGDTTAALMAFGPAF
jgi:hypothetical protein